MILMIVVCLGIITLALPQAPKGRSRAAVQGSLTLTIDRGLFEGDLPEERRVDRLHKDLDRSTLQVNARCLGNSGVCPGQQLC